MKKKLLLMVMAVSAMTLFTACGKKEDEKEEVTVEEVTEEVAEEETEEVTEEVAEEVAEEVTEEETEEVVTGPQFYFEIPTEFVESDTEGLYITENYPEDGSNVYYLQAAADPASVNMSQEDFEAQIVSTYEEMYEETITLNVQEFTKTTVAGVDALRIMCSYTFAGIEIQQLEYLIAAEDASYVVTYTQTGDSDWMETFEASVATFDFVTE